MDETAWVGASRSARLGWRAEAFWGRLRVWVATGWWRQGSRQRLGTVAGCFASALMRKRKGWVSQLRVDINELLIHSLLITLRWSFTCLGWQICTEDCCRGYYATVCYFNEVLNKIVSTSGIREMTCHKALVKLSNKPEPTDLQDTVQGSAFLFPSDLGQMGWLEAPYQCVGEGPLMLSPSFKYWSEHVEGPCDGSCGRLVSRVPVGFSLLQRAEGARLTTGCSWVSATMRDQPCTVLELWIIKPTQGDCSASGEGKPQPSHLLSGARADEVCGDVVQAVPDPLQPSALAAVPRSALCKCSMGILSQSRGSFNSLQCRSEMRVSAVWCSPVRLGNCMSPLRLLLPLGCCSEVCSLLAALRAHRLPGPCSETREAQQEAACVCSGDAALRSCWVPFYSYLHPAAGKKTIKGEGCLHWLVASTGPLKCLWGDWVLQRRIFAHMVCCCGGRHSTAGALCQVGFTLRTTGRFAFPPNLLQRSLPRATCPSAARPGKERSPRQCS